MQLFLFISGHLLDCSACHSGQRLQVCCGRRWRLRQAEWWRSPSGVKVREASRSWQAGLATRPAPACHNPACPLRLCRGRGIPAAPLFETLPWARFGGQQTGVQLPPQPSKVTRTESVPFRLARFLTLHTQCALALLISCTLQLTWKKHTGSFS